MKKIHIMSWCLLSLVIILGFITHEQTDRLDTLEQRVNHIDTIQIIEQQCDTLIHTSIPTFMYEQIRSEDKDAFALKVLEVSENLGVPYKHLMCFIYFGSKLNPEAKNTKFPFRDGTCAYGFIQITPVARKQLGITYKELQNMSDLEQVDLVEDYFIRHKRNINCFSDLCLVGYLPAYLDKPNSFKIPNKYIASNPGLGKSIGEFRKIENRRYKQLLLKYN